MKSLAILIVVVMMLILGGLVTIASAGNSDVTLAWDAPTTNEDGTPLTDLKGYKIYYGHKAGTYTINIDVGNVTTYKVTKLPDGKYFFAATAYDITGNESAYSNEVQAVLDTVGPKPPSGCKILKILRR